MKTRFALFEDGVRPGQAATFRTAVLDQLEPVQSRGV